MSKAHDSQEVLASLGEAHLKIKQLEELIADLQAANGELKQKNENSEEGLRDNYFHKKFFEDRLMKMIISGEIPLPQVDKFCKVGVPVIAISEGVFVANGKIVVPVAFTWDSSTVNVDYMLDFTLRGDGNEKLYPGFTPVSWSSKQAASKKKR